MTIPTDPNVSPSLPWHNSQTCKFELCGWYRASSSTSCLPTTGTDPNPISYANSDNINQNIDTHIRTSPAITTYACFACRW